MAAVVGTYQLQLVNGPEVMLKSLKRIQHAGKTLKAQTHTENLKSLINDMLKSRKTYLKISHPNRFKDFIHKI